MPDRPMPPLRFVPRPIPPVAELDPVERAQVVAAGLRYDGVELAPELRLAAGEDAGEEGEAWYQPSRWSVLDVTGAAVFDVWLYNVDSGTLFHAGTDEPAADLIQFGFEYPGDRATWAALAEAHLRACKEHPDGDLRLYDFSLGEE